MASVRLTNSIRDAIRIKVMNRAFDKLHADTKDQEHKLAAAVYRVAFTAKQRKLMDSLPQGWLPELNYMRVEFKEGTIGYTNLTVKDDEKLRVPNNKNNYNAIAVIESGHILEEVALKWKKDKEDIRQRYEKTRLSVCAILDSVTTVKKLIDIWPEAKEFILPYMSESKCTLPAIQFKEVNKMLGLPPKKN